MKKDINRFCLPFHLRFHPTTSEAMNARSHQPKEANAEL